MDEYCRLCLSVTSDHFYEITNTSLVEYQKQVEIVLPEINLSLTQCNVMCLQCTDFVSSAYSFKRLCYEVDKHLRAYTEAHHTKSVPIAEIIEIKRNISVEIPSDQNKYEDRANLVIIDPFSESVKEIKEEMFTEDEEQFESALCNLEAQDNLVKDETQSEDELVPNIEVKCLGKKNLQEPGEVTTKTPHYCKSCNKHFSTKYTLSRHIDYHQIQTFKSLKCKFCDETFPTKSLELVHRMTVHRNSNFLSVNNKFKCKFCDKEFTTKRQEVAHRKITHRELECKACNRIFKTESSFRRHATNHIVETFKCDINDCTQSFVMKSSLVKHKKTHTFIRCNECGETSKSLLSHKNHMKRHSGEYTCNICGMSFANSSVMKEHHLIHTGEKKFVCELCGKAFTQNSTLRTHIQGVHAETKPFVCEFCGKSFAKKILHRLHVTSMHIEPGKRFTCDICGKGVRFKSALSDHIKRHKGIKPHACSVCNKRFVDTSSLKKHMRCHGNEKPFECIYCHKQTNQKYNLTIHLKSCAKRKEAEQNSALENEEMDVYSDNSNVS